MDTANVRPLALCFSKPLPKYRQAFQDREACSHKRSKAGHDLTGELGPLIIVGWKIYAGCRHHVNDKADAIVSRHDSVRLQVLQVLIDYLPCSDQ